MINVILINLVSQDYCGIDKYTEVMNLQHKHIKIHYLIFETYKSLPTITIQNDCYHIRFYYPTDSLKIKHYRLMYEDILLHYLKPLFSPMQNLIWHVNSLTLDAIIFCLKNELGGRYIIHLHGIPWKFLVTRNKNAFIQMYSLYKDENFEKFRKEENSKIEYNKADAIICLSDSAKYYLERVHNIHPNKIIKIYNGIDILPSFTQRDKLTILFAGRIARDKGVFDFLDAVSDVYHLDYYPKIIMAGYCYVSKETICSKYKNIDIEFLGQISFCELKKLYAKATFGVIPSLHEQCSYVAIEMAAFGLPLIVSDVDALSEIFEDRKTALFNKLSFDRKKGLFAENKIFVENIIEMIENPPLREKLSRNLRVLYREKFTSSKMINSTFNLYEKLAEIIV